jgi:hypothetical protein
MLLLLLMSDAGFRSSVLLVAIVLAEADKIDYKIEVVFGFTSHWPKPFKTSTGD